MSIRSNRNKKVFNKPSVTALENSVRRARQLCKGLPPEQFDRTYSLLLSAIEADHGIVDKSCNDGLFKFIDNMKLTSNLDRTTAIVYYKTVREKIDSLSELDIQNAYVLIKRKVPTTQNLRELSSAKYDKRIDFRDGRIRLTETGKKYIEDKLQKIRGNKPAKRVIPRRVDGSGR